MKARDTIRRARYDIRLVESVLERLRGCDVTTGREDAALDRVIEMARAQIESEE